MKDLDLYPAACIAIAGILLVVASLVISVGMRWAVDGGLDAVLW